MRQSVLIAVVLAAQAVLAQVPPQPATAPGQIPPRATPTRDQVPAKGTATLRGQIVAADTGTPIRRALVRAFLREGGGGIAQRLPTTVSSLLPRFSLAEGEKKVEDLRVVKD